MVFGAVTSALARVFGTSTNAAPPSPEFLPQPSPPFSPEVLPATSRLQPLEYGAAVVDEQITVDGKVSNNAATFSTGLAHTGI